MKKSLLVLAFLLIGIPVLMGQVADTASWRGQGKPTFKVGKSLVTAGGITAAVGGGIMYLATSPVLNPPAVEGQYHENMLTPIVYIAGFYCVLTGAAVVIAGIPLTVAGKAKMGCDGDWRDVRYPARGMGIILEGGYYVPDVLQARVAAGYHFGPHIFLGGGIAPGFWLDKSSHYDGGPSLSLPLYADFRWSFANRITTPYLGVSAGMEMMEPSPYLAADLGIRIRTSSTSTRSFWSSLSGEVAGGYARVGLKMGYSF